eukprot:95220-Prorocentrum_minimum.AAC.2
MLEGAPSERLSGSGSTGRPPASLTMFCSVGSSSCVTKARDSPHVPKRPERPARCISVAPSRGSVKLTTTFTCSRSTPRAVRS